ncbi:helix-turn-helix transcriptional regulator [Dysgonomonas sp. HGC4]|uniref:helix-turn-helix transcriptional regulator n=1 Tax=Dysgonomonas sp. HGC4 TaxID=1658009 RepID=UPI000AF2F5DF|nr:YafY family protein [Dysgonomonas sp. HGC4]MBD8347617.1 YafY family transcriptional regulator [Dysgonomonas sp. HGC4]
MNRIDRLSAILIMLQSSSSVKTKHISDRFNISVRTVYRDIKALEDAGIPITGDSRVGFSLVEGFKLPPLMFTEEEAFSFLAAERLVDRFSDFGFKENYRSGIEKIKAVMRLAERETIDNFSPTIDSLDFQFQNPTDSQNILQAVMRQIANRKQIVISYFSYNKQELSNRKIDPIGIFFSMSNWYLIAFCHIKKDYQTFRVNRIKNIIETDNNFEREHPSFKSLLKTLGDKQDLHEVILEVNKTEYSLIDESKYYQGLIKEKEEGEKVELHFMVFSLERFARWYLSFLDVAKILYPQDFKKIIKIIINNAKM